MKGKIILLVIIISVSFLFFSLYKNNSPPRSGKFVSKETIEWSEDNFFNYEILRYPTDVTIIKPGPQQESRIGIVVDSWNLRFGTIPTGGNYVSRYVALANRQEKKAKIDFNVFGDISPMVSFSKNNFILDEYENITITVYLRTTETTQPGNYSGEIDVIIKRPKYDFLYNLLEWI